MRFSSLLYKLFAFRLFGRHGFSLVELLTMIALLGVISTALYTILNNMNAQSERLRIAANLTYMAEQARHFLHIPAMRAGYYSAGRPTISRVQAVNIPEIGHIQFCGESPSGQLTLTEFRLSPLPRNIFVQQMGRLEQRISQTGCVADALQDWESLTDKVFSAIEFRIEPTTPPNPPSAILDVKLTLRQAVPGTEENLELTRRYLLSLYALIGVN